MKMTNWKPLKKNLTFCILSKYFSTEHFERWNLVKNGYKNENFFSHTINKNFTFLLKVIKNVNFINIKT